MKHLHLGFFTCLALSLGTAFADDRITLLDGEVLNGDVLTLGSAELAIKGADAIPLDQVRLVETGSKLAPQPANRDVGLELVDGSRLELRTASIKSERVTVSGDFAKDWMFSLDHVRRLRLKPRRADENYKRLYAADPADFDQILIEVDGELQMVKGVIASLDEDTLEFEWEDERERLDRKLVYAIVIADSGRKPRFPKSRITLDDHTLLNVNAVEVKKGKLTAKVLGGSTFELPWTDVVELSMNADRLVFLSDLEPTEYYKEPLIAPTRDWRRDATVAGGKITLGGRAYRKGVGMSSKMTLSFSAERKFDFLRATIGIDDDTEQKGHCVFMVLKDGEEAARIPISASAGPKPLNLDIKDTETVTLIVDYGKDLDLADHADWAEVCFVKEEEE